MRIVMAIAVTALCACGRDQPATSPIAATVEKAAAALPGLQVFVEHRGKVILDRGFGLADLENETRVDVDTVFCIGSISKQFGAAAIMQLVEAGKLKLDDTLATYDPTFPRAERITIRDLLRHTSGIEDFEYTGPWPATQAVERTDAEVVALFKDRPALFEPNTGWSYSTSNYVVLGQIIEKVSGQPLREYMRTRVFERAGLRVTRFCDPYELIANRADGYDMVKGTFVPAKMQIFTQFSVGGGICSTARELIKWQKALESGVVVSAESYKQMSTPTPLADGTPIGYGFGLFDGEFAGHRLMSHEGGVSGFSSTLYHFIDDDLRISMITNARAGTPTSSVAIELLKIPAPVAVPIAVTELAKYARKFPVEKPYVLETVVDNQVLAMAFLDNGKEGFRLPLVHVGGHTFEDAKRHVRVRYDMAARVVVLTMSGMNRWYKLDP